MSCGMSFSATWLLAMPTARRCSVVLNTLYFESNNPSSTLGSASIPFYFSFLRELPTSYNQIHPLNVMCSVCV